MTSILENFIKAISDKYKISLNEAFEILSMFSILGRPLDEIYKEYWVAGTNDGGIDGIYIDEDTGNVHIFQSKNSKQLKQKDIQKFKSDYKNFFESGNTSNIEINEKIQAFIDEIKDFGEKGRILKPILYFCYSGENTDPPNAKIFKKFAKLVGNPPFFIKDSVLLIENLKSLQGIQRSSIVEFSFHPVSSEIYPGEQAIFSFYTQQIKAANFRISAIELCKLI
ncbi:MAG: hypothetical protein U1D31_01450, partial [Patescibacteria group bacterium]|nr:hypothetical protein [Patescibacteria group bacterium]